METTDPLAACALIRDRVAFIDTITILTRRQLGPEALRTLKEFQAIFPCGKSRAARAGFYWRYVIPQPSRKALEYLSVILAPDSYRISQIEIAVDLIVDSWEAAERVGDFLVRHLVQNWRGKRRSVFYSGTSYWREASTTRNLVLYHDLRSKITGQYCAHFEFRFQETEKCRTAVRRALGDMKSKHKALTIQEVLALDHHAVGRLIMHETRLRIVDLKRLERNMHRRCVEISRNSKGKKSACDNKRALRRILPHSVRSPGGQTPSFEAASSWPVQDLLDRKAWAKGVDVPLVDHDGNSLLPTLMPTRFG